MGGDSEKQVLGIPFPNILCTMANFLKGEEGANGKGRMLDVDQLKN